MKSTLQSTTPIKTLSFAAVLAISVSAAPTANRFGETETAELPTAEDLSSMGASKGLLLTHNSCELRTLERESEGCSSKGDGNSRKA
jgi:hypothetical protein